MCNVRGLDSSEIKCSASPVMSARVFNRFAMSEARAPRGPPPGQEIERVRRVLFVDPSPNCNQVAQARQVAAEQLADNIKQKSQQWNFDFGKGVPLNNANSRLQWHKPEPTEKVPEAYSLERLPYLSTHADSDISDNESATSDNTVLHSSRQKSITEFMSKRKSSSSAGCSKPVTSSPSSSAAEPASKKQKTSSS